MYRIAAQAKHENVQTALNSANMKLQLVLKEEYPTRTLKDVQTFVDVITNQYGHPVTYVTLIGVVS